MSIDVSQFVLNNVVDTCAVWNILSSDLLYSTSRDAACLLCCTETVRYECLDAKRSRPTGEDQALIGRMRAAIARGEIVVYALDVEDLQDEMALRNRKRLGRGELSSIVWAIKTRQAFLTDDQAARALARTVLPAGHVQTTPHLLGWLTFTGRIGGRDKDHIVAEHAAMLGPLGNYFEKAYGLALEYRRLQTSPPSAE